MDNRILYFNRNCNHCQKLLIGINNYSFIKPMFHFVEIIGANDPKKPQYITSVPSLIVNGNLLKGDDVFNYINTIVQKILEENPNLQTKSNESPPQQPPPEKNKEDDMLAWCPGDGCSFSPITEDNDDCANQIKPIDSIISYISDSNDNLSESNTHKSIQTGSNNNNYQQNNKIQQMDDSYERLMNERKMM